MKLRVAFFAAVLAFVCMAMAPATYAWDETDHVYVAPNGVGDALIFPVYLAAGTFKTNIRVINTSCEFAVVAKVVFREGLSSCEVRDFLIYLTPNDMWEAEIIDDDGTVTIVSDDDSSPVVPLSIPVATSCNGYPANLGYLEVYGAYAFADFNATACPVLGVSNACRATPVPKADLIDAYTAAPVDLSILADCPVDPALNSNHIFCDCDVPVSCVSWPIESGVNTYGFAEVWRSQPVLAGVEELVVPDSGLVMPMVATALANNCNYIKLNPLVETRWDSYGVNSAFEVRAALSKESLHIPFRSNATNATLGLLNFPAKNACCTSGSDDCDGEVSDCVSSEGDLCLNCNSLIGNDTDCEHRVEFQTTWSVTAYDMEEHTTTPDEPIFSPVPPSQSRPPFRNEVELFDLEDYSGYDLTGAYTEGWIRMVLTDACVQREGLTLRGDPLIGFGDRSVWYNGSAVIPTYIQLGSGDLSWVPATYDCANVVVSDATIDGFSCPQVSCPAPAPVACGDFDNCSYQDTSLDKTPWTCGE